MPRVLRCTAADTTQHVIQRGNNRIDCFSDAADYRLFGECLADAVQRYRCDVHAYVFMKNHVHLLVTPRTEGAIGKVMQSVGRRYVRLFNERHRRSGTLWEGRYRAKPIRTPRHLLTGYRYIELNPVRAGVVDNPGDYRWSSYLTNASGRCDELITPHSCYDALGRDIPSRLAAYRELFAIPIDDTARVAIRPYLTQAQPYSRAQ